MVNAKTKTIIIGASAAGLACAACLKKKGIPFQMLEQHSAVAYPWRNHYDRLHLNTDKKRSSLPYLPFPDDTPPYPSKNEVIQYMERYKDKFQIRPEFNQKVTSVLDAGDEWEVKTETDRFVAPNVIIATGFNRKPYLPSWPGIERFKGKIIHSAEYKNGAPYAGRRVLVVGFGNSACEISICLHEYGAHPSLSVKGAVNIVPRGNGNNKIEDFFDSFAWVSKLLPEIIDKINAPALHKRYGDYGAVGLRKLPYGPNVQIVRHKRVPVLDIGTFDLIKNGMITVLPGIDRFTETGVYFTGGRFEEFDNVILATGYKTAVSDFLLTSAQVLDTQGRPLESGTESAPGLFFCGFNTSPLGMLRQIGLEAKAIAQRIKKKK